MQAHVFLINNVKQVRLVGYNCGQLVKEGEDGLWRLLDI